MRPSAFPSQETPLAAACHLDRSSVFLLEAFNPPEAALMPSQAACLVSSLTDLCIVSLML